MEFLDEKKQLMTTTLTTPYVYYNQAPKLNPKGVEYLNEANKLFEEQQIARTTELYQEALAENPESPELLSNTGAILAAQGNLGEAFNLLKKAAEKGTCAGAHYNLGTLFIAANVMEQAKEQLEKGVALDPKSAPILNNLGIVHLQLGDHTKAKEFFTKTTEVAPAFDYAYHNLGAIAYDENHFEEAITYFHKALEHNAQNYASLNDLGCVVYLEGKTKEAVNFFKKAIEAGKSYRLPLYNLGYVVSKHHLV